MIKKKVLIMDTSILCVWLKVPGKTTCGNKEDEWDKERVDKKINEEIKAGTVFVLPVASIIETGNHITQSSGDKYSLVNEFADFILQSIDGTTPWASFSPQSKMWSSEGLRKLTERWRVNAISGQSLGDAAIVDVAEYYAQAGYEVEILTGDKGLKAYQPSLPPIIPRRRK